MKKYVFMLMVLSTVFCNDIRLSKEQAWDILVQATAKLELTRDNHNLVLQALEILKPVKDLGDKL